MFLKPVYLLLLLVVAALLAVYVVLQLRRKTYVARFSNVELLGSVAPRRPGWRRHLTFALLLIGLSVLSVGVAKPATSVKVPRDEATVILAIDVSLSMKATDVTPSRIKAAQAAARSFTALLPPRINLGLVSFARTGNVLVSPTTNRAQVNRAVDGLQLASYTAIGDGIVSSLSAIKSFATATQATGVKPPPARIVLLSDGERTVGTSIATAIADAKAAKVKVSTIAFGTDNGTVTADGQTVRVPANRPQLRSIAEGTGGTFDTAVSESQLRKIYADIGSQIGYTTEHRDISYRFLVAGLLVLFGAGAASMLWAGRLV
ncbi:VWA domain-containing protein [uncultured Jatrophihabitans sp.]|uniref:VWA domain-containing protein n=1 Tax=uncultured Jatrophihabitans sp. TaxID=1610747 RepID=UPI0035CA9863